jgi:hypothetical protein
VPNKLQGHHGTGKNNRLCGISFKPFLVPVMNITKHDKNKKNKNILRKDH